MMISAFSLEFVIIISFAVVATLFVIGTSIALVVRKTVEVKNERTRNRLYTHYARIFVEILTQTLPQLPLGSKASDRFKQFESLVAPIKEQLAGMIPSRRNAHRLALRTVLIDFTHELTGESAARLNYFAYSFGLVEEQLAKLQDRQWWVRAQAVRNLGLIRARKAIAKLTAALEDEHHDVRNQAIKALLLIVEVDALKSIFRVSKTLSQWEQVELSIIVKEFGEKAVPHLIEAMEAPDQSEAEITFSIAMLAQLGVMAAVEPLERLIRNSPSPVVQAKAAEALGLLGDRRAEGALMGLIDADASGVRLRVIEALGRLGSPSSVAILAQRNHRGDLPEKIAIARALSRCGAKGVKVLRVWAGQHNTINYAVALQTLEEAGIAAEAGV